MLTTSSRTSVLSTNSDIPPVTKTTMGADLLQALEVVTEGDGNLGTVDLVGLAAGLSGHLRAASGVGGKGRGGR